MDCSEVLSLISSVLRDNAHNGSKVSDLERVFNDVISEFSLIHKDSKEEKGQRDLTIDENIIHRFNDVITQLKYTSNQREPEFQECPQLTTLYETEAELGRKIEAISIMFP